MGIGAITQQFNVISTWKGPCLRLVTIMVDQGTMVNSYEDWNTTQVEANVC